MRDASPRFSNVREMVEACGGQAALADRLNVTAAAVSLWVTKDALPPARIPDVMNALAERNATAVEADLWPLVRLLPRGPARSAEAASVAA